MTATSSRWTNWSGSVTAHPRRVSAPTTETQLSQLISGAAETGGRVKPVGSGHSFTAIAAASDTQIDMEPLRRKASVRGNRVTVSAGITLGELNLLIDRHGLALPNLGDIDAQTLAGATSTGTHGTGARLGGLATFISALRLVDGNGQTRRFDREDPDFGAVVLGLGALGVITEITLDCVPAFRLHAVERPLPVERAIGEFDDLAAANDHMEFYWFPGAEQVLLKRNNRATAGEPLPPVRRWIDDELMSNSVYAAACRLARAVPGTSRTVTATAARLMSQREFTDASFRVFCTPRRVRFQEMEYALPREAFGQAFAALRTIADRYRVVFPVEVRVAAADELWLSTAYRRDSVYLAVHQYRGMPYREYFAEVEAVMRVHDGRPHWGKIHTRAAADLATVYPRLGDFQQLRDRLDPHRVFANPYLERVLGP